MPFKVTASLLILCLDDLSIDRSVVLGSPTLILLSSVSLFNICYCLPYTFMDSYVRCMNLLGFSDAKESACDAGDLDFIPGPGRSPGEEIGY